MELWRICLLLVVVTGIAGCVDSSTGEMQKELVEDEFQDGFVEKEVRYGAVESLTDVGGKLAYIGLTHDENGFWNESFIVFDGETLAEDYLVKPGTTDMNTPLAVDGKLVYWAKQGHDEFVVVDGEEGERHGSVTKITEIGGKLAYRIVDREFQKNESESSSDPDIIQAPDFSDVDVFTVYDGKRLADQVEYTPVSFPREVGGDLTFVAESDNQWFIVHGGEEVGRQYENATAPRDINGILAYKVVRDDDEILVYEGHEVGRPYDWIDMDSVANINGKLAFKAREDGEEFIVFKGERLGENYDHVSNPINVGEKLAYSLGNKSGEESLRLESFILMYGGEELGEQYDQVLWTGAVVDGKPAFKARMVDENGGIETFVVVGETERTSFGDVSSISIQEIDGKLVYVAFEDREAIVVYGDQEIGNGYEEILAGPTEMGGELVFAAGRNGKVYIVREQ